MLPQALARANIASGGHGGASTAVLRWGDEAAARDLAGAAGFDLILAADVLYFAGDEVARRLTDTVAIMLAPTPDARAVFANHGSWFTASLERCLEASAEASGLGLSRLPNADGSKICELRAKG